MMKTKKVGTVLQEVEGQRIRVTFWQVGGLLLIKVDEGLFTIAQMYPDTYLRFFDLRSEGEDFGSVDLNECQILFTVAALAIRRKGEKALLIQDDRIRASKVPMERLFINAHLSSTGKFPWRGGELVDTEGRPVNAGLDQTVLIENLDAKKDRDIILKAELTNMWTYEDMILRLDRYFKTGVNIDQLKYKIFPDLEPVGPVTDTLR